MPDDQLKIAVPATAAAQQSFFRRHKYIVAFSAIVVVIISGLAIAAVIGRHSVTPAVRKVITYNPAADSLSTPCYTLKPVMGFTATPSGCSALLASHIGQGATPAQYTVDPLQHPEINQANFTGQLTQNIPAIIATERSNGRTASLLSSNPGNFKSDPAYYFNFKLVSSENSTFYEQIAYVYHVVSFDATDNVFEIKAINVKQNPSVAPIAANLSWK